MKIHGARSRIWPSALVAALASGCSAAARTPDAAQPPPPPPLSDADIRALVVQVSAVRQLAEKRMVRVSRLDEQTFAAAVRRGIPSAPPSDHGLSPSAALLLGFDLLPPPEQRARVSTVREVLEEQIVGFYDDEADQVFVRAAAPRSLEEALEQRAILAHEVHHALQAQHFAIPDATDVDGDDARLARLALIEGDAMVAMAAYLGAEHGAPIRRTLRAVTDVTKKVSLDRVSSAEQKQREKLDRALPITRERIQFPYIGGMSFVSDIYRAGGFPLVDRLYSRIPTSTEQILHPEKYLAGEQPTELVPPPPPPGHQVVLSQRLGELQTRVVLSGCAPDHAERGAAGWAGDSFTIVAGPDRRVALLWSTAWDTDGDAAEFEAVVRGRPGCWRETRLDGGASFRVDGGHAVARDGKRVAFVRGLPEPAASTIAREILTLPARTPAPTPVAGSWVIPPREPLPEPVRGQIRGDVYRSDWLGVYGRIPPGMRPVVGRDVLELMIDRDDVLVAGAFAVSDRVTTPHFNEIAFHEIATAFANQLDGTGLVAVSGGESQIPLGRSIERTWQVVGTTVQVRAVMVSICAGTGSLVFLQAYADPYARSVLDGWMQSFTWMGRDPPVCRRLDPK